MYSGMSAACSCMRCFCRALQATCYCDCSLCGLQLQHIAAGTESCNGDWQKPILRFSFCNGLHIPFVKHLCNVNVTVHRRPSVSCVFMSQAQTQSSRGAMLLIWRAPKTMENRDLGHQKS